jgi:epoxide hydrolase-like predicted phosphatase
VERIESVIFDWGGVLIDDPTPPRVRYCADALGVSEEDYERAQRKFAADFQKGLIDEDTLWEKVCTELNVSKPTGRSLWGDAFRAVYSPKVEMFSMVSSLRENGYKTALLSNCEVPAMQCFYELGYGMFDIVVFSCAEGIRKPDRRIYELTLARLGSQPAQSVFIDDAIEYIDAANEVGIHTILFLGIEQLKSELGRLGVRIE